MRSELALRFMMSILWARIEVTILLLRNWVNYSFFPSFIGVYLINRNGIFLRYMTGCFDVHICCEVIITIKLVSIYIALHSYHFSVDCFCGKSYALGRFQVYNTALLTLIMLLIIALLNLFI